MFAHSCRCKGTYQIKSIHYWSCVRKSTVTELICYFQEIIASTTIYFRYTLQEKNRICTSWRQNQNLYYRPITHSFTHSRISLTHESHSRISHSQISHPRIPHSQISHSWIVHESLTHESHSLTNLTHESLTHSWISLTNLTHSRISLTNLIHEFLSDTFICKVWNFPCNRQSHESYNQCLHIHADIREHITLNPYITDPVCGNLLYPDGFPHTGPAMQQASITLLFLQQLFQANLESIKATTLLSPCVGNPTLSVGIRAHWDHQL